MLEVKTDSSNTSQASQYIVGDLQNVDDFNAALRGHKSSLNQLGVIGGLSSSIQRAYRESTTSEIKQEFTDDL